MKHFLSFTFSLLVTANVFSQFVDTVTNFTFENSNPIPSTRNVSGYSGCLLTTTTIQEWLPDSSSWRNVSLTTNHYNANDHIDTTTLQKWVLVNWVDSSRSFYTYNADATVKQTINQTSDGLTWTN